MLQHKLLGNFRHKLACLAENGGRGKLEIVEVNVEIEIKGKLIIIFSYGDDGKLITRQLDKNGPRLDVCDIIIGACHPIGYAKHTREAYDCLVKKYGAEKIFVDKVKETNPDSYHAENMKTATQIVEMCLKLLKV